MLQPTTSKVSVVSPQTPNEGSRSRSSSSSSQLHMHNIQMTAMGFEAGESDVHPNDQHQVNIIASNKKSKHLGNQNPLYRVKNNEELMMMQSTSEVGTTPQGMDGIGMLLMYSIILTYMVFVDPKNMVCSDICK
eukprot:344060_1